MRHHILLNHFYLAVPGGIAGSIPAPANELGTVLANLAYFGYLPTKEATEALQLLTSSELATFWGAVEPAFSDLTADNRKMSEFVVYRNFPADVLSMEQGEYWMTQLLLYLGVPSKLLAGPSAVAKDRPALLFSQLNLKPLNLAPDNVLAEIYQRLVKSTKKWTDEQAAHAHFLHPVFGLPTIELEDFGFKLNGITLLAQYWTPASSLKINNATDVLRFAAALSAEDASLRQKVYFRKFTRPERRALLQMLDSTEHLEADVALRPALWKNLFRTLHPGDFKFPRVITAYHRLYKKTLLSFNQIVNQGLINRDPQLLEVMISKPGEFARRLHVLYDYFEGEAIHAFKKAAKSLSVTQLLSLQRYLLTINNRKWMMYAPKGNWSKVVMAPNNKVLISTDAMHDFLKIIGAELQRQLKPLYPEGATLPPMAGKIKLQTNDQELATYGRGTSFSIPEDMTYVRTASFWKNPGITIWYDNGFNLFDADWKPLDSICWNSGPKLLATSEGLVAGDNFESDTSTVAAVFSGDPINGHELEGRACQMIDLYFAPLKAAGVRYAVWNILAYSNRTFNQAEDVVATLQWGNDPNVGNLYEPARAQMVFPLKGNSLTKYVALIDLETRQLIYLDANLPGRVSSAKQNEQGVSEKMPAYLEYLGSLPSVKDYFSVLPENGPSITVEECLTGAFRKD